MADYLKIPELARRLDVSEKTARRYVKAGTLPSTFIGGAYRVAEEDLEEFLHRSEVKPEDASPKVESRSSPEPSLFNGLEGERHLLDYRKCREALDRFCDYWDLVLGDQRLDRRACDEFETSAKLTSRLLIELWRAEKVELQIQRGDDPQTVDKFEPWSPGLVEQSELWPAVDRWMALGMKINEIAKKEFDKDTTNEITDMFEFSRRKAG